MTTVISVEHLSKSYRLGQIGTPSPADTFAGRTAGTFVHDLNRWWAKVRGKPDPMLRIGEDLWSLRDVFFTVEQGEELGIPSMAPRVGITRSVFLLSFDPKPYITEAQHFCSGRRHDKPYSVF